MVFAIYAVMIANNSLTKRMEEFERDEIMAALEDCGWVMARAARSLGITERMIGYKVNKYGLRKEVKDGRGHVAVKQSLNQTQ